MNAVARVFVSFSAKHRSSARIASANIGLPQTWETARRRAAGLER